MLDFTSLLVAAGFSATCLAATLAATWVASRTDGFLLTCAFGALLVAVGAGFSAFYIARPSMVPGIFAFAFMLAGLATLYGTARQFRDGRPPWRAIIIVGALALLAVVPFHAVGYNGIGFVVGYLVSALLLAMTALEYWRARPEAPSMVTAIALHYLAIALSFLPRALLVILAGEVIIEGQPSNWAENLSLLLVVAAIPGIGAMTMMLNQRRLVRTHKQQAMTDPLTGLLNRRALFEAFDGELTEPIVAVLFDLDHFKNINDTHGHATGDRIIALFARALKMDVARKQWRARLGGEEFALISSLRTLQDAINEAERIRARFAALTLREEGLHCTVSAGIACSSAQLTNLDAVLNSADRALYEAKHSGRDRVVVARWEAAGHGFSNALRAGVNSR